MKRILIFSCLAVSVVRFAAAQVAPPAAPGAVASEEFAGPAADSPQEPASAATAAPAPPATPAVEDDDRGPGPGGPPSPWPGPDAAPGPAGGPGGPGPMAAQAQPPHPPHPPAPPMPPNGWGKGSYLGIGVQEVVAERAKELKLPEERGVEVTRVAPDSPAAKAGLKEGDVVLDYNGQRIEGVEQFVRLVRETPAGRQAKLLISRGGATQTLTATIAEHNPFPMGQQFQFDMGKMGEDLGRQLGPDSKFQRDMQKMQRDLGRMHFDFEPPDMPQGEMVWRTGLLGIEAESVNAQLAEFFGVKQGVLVRSVNKDSAAEKAGLKAGDIITKVGDTEVARPGDVTRQLRQAPSGKPAVLSVVRNHHSLSLNVTVESKPASTGETGPRRIRNNERREGAPPAPAMGTRLVSSPGGEF
jgi:serine protease Do